MVHFKGFKTLEEAREFKKKNGKGSICGRIKPNYKIFNECVLYGGLDGNSYPYAVVWNETKP